tara:strand:- start:3281 stop:6322 length:3042 start_codon:yes stop_codon:yes gene_type:complete
MAMVNSGEVTIGIDVETAKDILSAKMYESDGSALREQVTNALSHGCGAYHEKFGYTDEVYVDIAIDHGDRTVTIRDNGMGMSRETFKNVYMYFGKKVSKTVNNKRSGMFGLGAVSFYRIASSCIVEVFHRETNEHYTFMTRGKAVTEVLDGNKTMVGGKHDPENNIIGDYGTKTTIYLKENVRIRELIKMIKVVASNYPARTLLHVTNSEGEQSIQTYQQNDQDEEVEFPAVITFEDFVKAKCGETQNYKKVMDDEYVEVYLTDIKAARYGEEIDAYLCRVPLKLELHNFSDNRFVVFMNIKQEKFPGTDDEGNDALCPIPMTNRDRAEKDADEWIDTHINETILSQIKNDYHFTTVDEYRAIPVHWMQKAYNMNKYYDDETTEFVQSMQRILVRRRDTVNGLSKANSPDNMWQVICRHTHIFYHATCHLDSFLSVKHYLTSDEKNPVDHQSICIIGETVEQRKKYEGNNRERYGKQMLTSGDHADRTTFANNGMQSKTKVEEWIVHDFQGLNVLDIKEFKKQHTIKLPKADKPSYDSGAKVWIPTSYDLSISLTEESLENRQLPIENVYWAGDYLKYSDIRSTRLLDIPGGSRARRSTPGNDRLRGGMYGYGLIVAKKYPKSIPKIDVLFEQVEELIDSGEVYTWDIESDKRNTLEAASFGKSIALTEPWNWNQYQRELEPVELDPSDLESGMKVVEKYKDYVILDSEKHLAFTINKSALLRHGVNDNGRYRTDLPNPFLNYGSDESRTGILFCPAKWVHALGLYLVIKHGERIHSTHGEYGNGVLSNKMLVDLKQFSKWTTADADAWTEYHEEKRWNEKMIRWGISKHHLKNATVKRMTQWAKEGLIDKFEKIEWDDKDHPVYESGYVEGNELEDRIKREQVSLVDNAMKLLLDMHPEHQMKRDIIKCGIKKEDCITVNVMRGESAVLPVDKSEYGYKLFIKASKFGNASSHASNPTISTSYITFDDVKIKDGEITYVIKKDINEMLDDNWYYHKNELYRVFMSHEWRNYR